MCDAADLGLERHQIGAAFEVTQAAIGGFHVVRVVQSPARFRQRQQGVQIAVGRERASVRYPPGLIRVVEDLAVRGDMTLDVVAGPAHVVLQLRQVVQNREEPAHDLGSIERVRHVGGGADKASIRSLHGGFPAGEIAGQPSLARVVQRGDEIPRHLLGHTVGPMMCDHAAAGDAMALHPCDRFVQGRLVQHPDPQACRAALSECCPGSHAAILSLMTRPCESWGFVRGVDHKLGL
jgi:hypothetical protein